MEQHRPTPGHRHFQRRNSQRLADRSLVQPVAITANTTYIVAYHTTAPYIAYTSQSLATAGIDNGPLHILANGVDGNNGVYQYGSSSFPTVFNGQSPNYWVDVAFVAG
jgi:hypothetical protein